MLVKTTARLRYVSVPPRKMRLVANMVKGMPVEKALNVLNFTPRVAAYHIAKTLKSAAANALSLQGTDHLKPEDLRVSGIVVDEAPAAKRIRFQSMGRVYRYKKRYCHLTVTLEAEVKAPTVKKAGTGRTRKEEAAEGADEKKAVVKQGKALKKASTVKKTAKEAPKGKTAAAPAKKAARKKTKGEDK
jgi:large subunit ribosomal protein L22